MDVLFAVENFRQYEEDFRGWELDGRTAEGRIGDVMARGERAQFTLLRGFC